MHPIDSAPHTSADEVSRRVFMRRAAAISLGFGGLRLAYGPLSHAVAGPKGPARAIGGDAGSGYGDVLRDPTGIFDLPNGFAYQVISRAGQKMDDGLLVPGRPDGMAAFAAGAGIAIIIRNHELSSSESDIGPFAPKGAGLNSIPASKIFDRGQGIEPALGGTTTLVYDTRSGKLLSQFMSLAGTNRNCAGGPTPWGTWLTCEEDVTPRGGAVEKMHGWVFEVPATTKVRLADPTPIKAMGRFNHEAVCVDPASGIVYLTEDRNDGLLFRFVPKVPGQLHKGGSLEALIVTGAPRRDTRNWTPEQRKGDAPGDATPIPVGTTLTCEWMALESIEAPDDDLRHRGFAAGAARFARGEGMWWGHNAAYFACTNGGTAQLGQLWRYMPSANENAPATKGLNTPGGTLELFIEPNDARVVRNADNITVAPNGDLFVCEDTKGDNRILRVTPDGQVSDFALNRLSGSELAGVCFSPDNSTMFVNIQHDHLTLAIRGPFAK